MPGWKPPKINVKPPKVPSVGSVVKKVDKSIKRAIGELDKHKHDFDGLNKKKAQAKVQDLANHLAEDYKSAKKSGDYDDCVVVVASGCVAAGTYFGGVPGAMLGASGGIPCARIACRRVFPEE